MKLSSMAILLIAVGAMMIPVMPSAMAMPDASIGGTTALVDGTSTLTISVGAATSSLAITSDDIRVYDTDKDTTGAASPCPLPDPGFVGVTTWQLYDLSGDSDDKIGYTFPAGSIESTSLTVDFGTGVNPVTVNIDSPGFLSVGASDKSAGVSIIAEWREITDNSETFGTTDPSTNRVGSYTVASCGTEDSGGATFEISANFKIELPVGGTLLPTSMPALLIAGISMNTMWMLPLMGAAVGVFALIKVKRKQN